MYQIHRLMVECRGGFRPAAQRDSVPPPVPAVRPAGQAPAPLRSAPVQHPAGAALPWGHPPPGGTRSPAGRAVPAPWAAGVRAAANCLPAPAHTELPARRSPAEVPPSPAHRRKAGSGNGGSPHWQRQDGGSTAPPERAGSGAVSRFPVRPAPSFPPLPAPCAEHGGIHGQRRHNNAPHSAAHWSCGSSAIRCAARCRLVPSLLLPLTRARDHGPLPGGSHCNLQTYLRLFRIASSSS